MYCFIYKYERICSFEGRQRHSLQQGILRAYTNRLQAQDPYTTKGFLTSLSIVIHVISDTRLFSSLSLSLFSFDDDLHVLGQIVGRGAARDENGRVARCLSSLLIAPCFGGWFVTR
jgi:hypothetical protein